MKNRIKHCNRCNIDFPTLYRIQYKNPKEWVFVCEDCLLKVKAFNSKKLGLIHIPKKYRIRIKKNQILLIIPSVVFL